MRFAAHTIDASVMFIVVAIPAFTLAMLVRAGERAGAPVLMVHVLTLVEYVILVLDSFVLLYCLVKSAWIFLRETE
jgi:hypothetical protein